jgi:hypothetical protein
MIRAFAYLILFMGLAITAYAQDSGNSATPVTTMPDENVAHKSAEKAKLEIEKLRLDIQAAQDPGCASAHCSWAAN